MPGYLDLFVGYTINFVVISYCPRTEDDFFPKCLNKLHLRFNNSFTIKWSGFCVQFLRGF